MDAPDDQTEGLWVSADPMPGGSYHIVMNLDADKAWPLSREKARLHAMTALAIAEEASYEQAMFAQATETLDCTADDALSMIAEFRHNALHLDHGATAPIRYIGGLNMDGKAFIHIQYEGEPVGQISVNALRRHALAMLQIRVVSDLDTVYRRLLNTTVGVNDDQATRAVNGLATHRPDDGYELQG